MAMSDEIDTPRLAVIGVVGTMIVLLVVFVVQVVYYKLTRELDHRRNVEHTDQALARYQAEQAEKLQRLGWIDAQAGVVAIPIERAMELVVRDLTARQQQPAAAAEAPDQRNGK